MRELLLRANLKFLIVGFSIKCIPEGSKRIIVVKRLLK